MPEIRDFEENYHSHSWVDVARAILNEGRFSDHQLERAGGTDHIVFFVGCEFVLKIYRPERDCFERERRALDFTAGRLGFGTPEIVFSGDQDGLNYALMTRMIGREMARNEFLSLDKRHQVSILTELATGLKQLHNQPPAGFSSDWAECVKDRSSTFVERQIEHGANAKIISQLPQYITESLPLVPLQPTVFLHGDVHFGNLRFDSTLAISGLFDFADSLVGWHEYDLLAIGVLMLQGERELQREFLSAYGYTDHEMNDEMRRRLMMLTMLYETSDLKRYAMRLRPDAVDLDLYELEKAIWCFV